MTESLVLSPPQPNRRFRRFLLWMVLGGVSLVFLGVVLLIGIALPDLRREVAPPEVSGPERVVLSPDLSKNTSSPTSGTLSVSGDTSETLGSLNLDDFPHLSPKMRELAQVWLDRYEETNKALDSITDPAVRARIRMCLAQREAMMRAFLNLPREWEDLPYEKARQRLLNYCRLDSYDDREPGRREQRQLLKKSVRLWVSYERELLCFRFLKERLPFEFYVYNGHWDAAAKICAQTYIKSCFDNPGYAEGWRNVNTRDEEVYCRRQMGFPGTVGLVARSYQSSLESLMKGHEDSSLYFTLQMVGFSAAGGTTPDGDEPASREKGLN